MVVNGKNKGSLMALIWHGNFDYVAHTTHEGKIIFGLFSGYNQMP